MDGMDIFICIIILVFNYRKTFFLMDVFENIIKQTTYKT